MKTLAKRRKYADKDIIIRIKDNNSLSYIKLDFKPFAKIEVKKTNDIIIPDLSISLEQNSNNLLQNPIKLPASPQIHFFSQSWKNKDIKYNNDKLTDAFMAEYHFALKTKDKESPKESAQSRFDRLILLQKDIFPVIRLERKNHKGEFLLFVDIISKKLAFNEYCSLKQVFKEKEEVL